MADTEPLLFRTVLGALYPKARETTLAKAVDRFWSSVSKAGDDDCWLWIGYHRAGSEYGVFSVSGQPRQATHVALYLDGRKPPSPEAMALHSCDVPACCNPAHLRWGDAQGNADDREARGRSVKPRGERHGHAKLNDDAIRFIRTSGWSLSKLQEKFGVSIRVLSLARAGKTWRHVP